MLSTTRVSVYLTNIKDCAFDEWILTTILSIAKDYEKDHPVYSVADNNCNTFVQALLSEL